MCKKYLYKAYESQKKILGGKLYAYLQVRLPFFKHHPLQYFLEAGNGFHRKT